MTVQGVTPIAHGGRLDAARARFPNAPTPWIDLSTGVNPHAYPLPALAQEVWTRLPDDEAFSACAAAARAAYGAPAGVDVVIGAGAQAFIQMIPQVFAASRVAVLGFTYAEHAARWRAAGARVATAETLAGLADADVGVIVNPNNPDGRMVAPDDIDALARAMAHRDAPLIVDESFVDFTPQHSIAALAARENVVVLRSFGKAYGLPGARLGFALAAPARAAALRAALGPWPVCGAALALGAVAFNDARWLAASAARCAQDAARLDALLTRAGFTLIGGTSLFRLAAHPHAARLHTHLCAQGVLARDFAERPAHLRFGLPGDEAAWTRLAAALEAGREL